MIALDAVGKADFYSVQACGKGVRYTACTGFGILDVGDSETILKVWAAWVNQITERNLDSIRARP